MRAALAPSPVELLKMLSELRRKCRTGNELADLMGVGQTTVDDWLSGRHQPNASGRRAIWLVWCMVCHPERCQTLFDLCTWGRFRRTKLEGRQYEACESWPVQK